MNKLKEIQELREEAQANLTLYVNGQDDYALQRYNQLMSYVRKLESSNSK